MSCEARDSWFMISRYFFLCNLSLSLSMKKEAAPFTWIYEKMTILRSLELLRDESIWSLHLQIQSQMICYELQNFQNNFSVKDLLIAVHSLSWHLRKSAVERSLRKSSIVKGLQVAALPKLNSLTKVPQITVWSLKDWFFQTVFPCIFNGKLHLVKENGSKLWKEDFIFGKHQQYICLFDPEKAYSFFRNLCQF